LQREESIQTKLQDWTSSSTGSQ